MSGRMLRVTSLSPSPPGVSDFPCAFRAMLVPKVLMVLLAKMASVV